MRVCSLPGSATRAAFICTWRGLGWPDPTQVKKCSLRDLRNPAFFKQSAPLPFLSSEAASSAIGLAAGVSNLGSFLFLLFLFLFLVFLFLLPTTLILLPNHCTPEVLDLLPDKNKFLYNSSLYKSRMMRSSMIQLKSKTFEDSPPSKSSLSSLALSSSSSPLRLDDILFVLQSLP